eukprot:gene26627-29217_t
MFHGSFNVSGWANHSFCGYHTVYGYPQGAGYPAFQVLVSVVGDPTSSRPPNEGCIPYGG